MTGAFQEAQICANVWPARRTKHREEDNIG